MGYLTYPPPARHRPDFHPGAYTQAVYHKILTDLTDQLIARGMAPKGTQVDLSVYDGTGRHLFDVHPQGVR